MLLRSRVFDLPADAQFVVIEGGNHSQFGNYGLQPGDNEATITAQSISRSKRWRRQHAVFLKELEVNDETDYTGGTCT